jgi:hypothetical protein
MAFPACLCFCLCFGFGRLPTDQSATFFATTALILGFQRWKLIPRKSMVLDVTVLLLVWFPTRFGSI